MKEPRIVLLERDDLAREIYTEYLVAAGFRVRAETLFDDALAALRKGNVPVLVVGIVPGGATVADVAARIRSVSPRTAVVALLGRDAAESGLRAVRDGALEALVRPVSAEALAVAVRRGVETVAMLDARPQLRRHVQVYQAVRRIQRAASVEALAGRLLEACLVRARADAGLVLRPAQAGLLPDIVAAHRIEEALAHEIAVAWDPGRLPAADVPVAAFPAGSGPLGGLRARIARIWSDAVVVRVGPPGPDRLLALLLFAPRAESRVAERPALRDDLQLYADEARFTLDTLDRFPDDGEASIDPLTDLYDATHLERALAHEIERAGQRGGSVAVLAVDIDGFRELNDTHGHVVGGRVLVEASRLLLRLVRDVDVAGRIGADAFGVLLAASDARAAERASRRIVEAFSRQRFLGREGLDLRLSVSTGAAVYPQHGTTARALLETALSRVHAGKARA